jgi:hypothetical protein
MRPAQGQIQLYHIKISVAVLVVLISLTSQQTSGSNMTSGNITSSPPGSINDSSFTMNVPPTGGIDWMELCLQADAIIIPSCSSLVSQNNVLTTEGDRVWGCIRNGLLQAGGAALLQWPLEVVIPALQVLSEPTGCRGIMKWNNVPHVENLRDLIDILT